MKHEAFYAKSFRLLGFVILVPFFFVFVVNSIFAATNSLINIQGRLVDNDGTNISASCVGSNICDFRLTVYESIDSTCNASDTQISQETFSNYVLQNGIFNFALGSGTGSTLSSYDFDSQYTCVRIQLDADGNGDFVGSEDFGTVNFRAVPYAYNARRSDATGGLMTSTTTVNVSGSSAPTSGQVLTAVDGSSATWQTPQSVIAGLDSIFWDWSNPLSKDSFTDTNGTLLTSHTPELGPSWSVNFASDSEWTIQSNQLNRSNNIIRHAYMDVGESDVMTCAQFNQLENLSALLIRRQDTGNYWELYFDYANQGWQLNKVVSGVDIPIGPTLTGTTGTVCLSAVGDTITGRSPAGDKYTVIDSDLNTQTGVGMILDGFGGIPSIVDNWIVVGLNSNEVSNLSNFYLNGGNSYGAGAVLGTNDNYSLLFETNNVTRALFDTNGHFTPFLDDTYDLGSNTNRWRDLYLGGTTLHIGTSDTDEGILSYDTTNNVFNISTDSTTNGDIAFNTNQLYIDKSTGRIGVGTNSPLQNLDIEGNIRVSGNIYDSANSIGGDGEILKTTPTGVTWVTPYEAFEKRYITTSTNFSTTPYLRLGRIDENAPNKDVVVNVKATTGSGTVTESTFTINIGYNAANSTTMAPSITASTSHSFNQDTTAENGFVLRNARITRSGGYWYLDVQKYVSNTLTIEVIPKTANNWEWFTGDISTDVTAGSNTSTIFLSQGVRGSSISANSADSSGYSSYGSYGGYTLSNTASKTNQWEYIGNVYIGYDATYRYGSSWNVELNINELTNNTDKSFSELDVAKLILKGYMPTVADATAFNTTVPSFSMELRGKTDLTTSDVGMLVFSSSTSNKYLRLYIRLKNPNTHYTLVPINRYGASYNSTGGMVNYLNYYSNVNGQAVIASLPTPAQGNVVNPVLGYDINDAWAYNGNDVYKRNSGNVGIGDTTPASLFTVGNGDLFQINSSGSIVAVKGVTVDTATATDDRILTSITTGGAARFDGTITNADLTAARTWTLPDADGTIALVGSSSSGYLLDTGDVGTGAFSFSGGQFDINASSNNNTNINTGTSTGTVSIGNALANVAITDGQWSVTGTGVATFVGINSGTGLIQGTGGLTLSGATNINNNASTNTTNIGTGTTTGAISIGGGSNTLTINTSNWDVSSAGILTGLTGLTSSGTVTFSGLSAGTTETSAIFRNASNQLVTRTLGSNAFNSTAFLTAEADTLSTVSGRGATTSTALILNGGASIRGLTIDTATATDDRILTSITTGGVARFDGTITNADLTAARTWTLPNADGTILLSSTGFMNGGNSYGAGAVLGTNDNYSLSFETNNVTRALFDTNGHFTPFLDDTYDLGSNTNRWRDLYLGGTTLHIGTSDTDEGILSYDTTNNVFNISTDSTTNGDIAFNTNQLYIDKSTGYIGIGTISPTAALTINNQATFIGTELVSNGTFTGSSTGWILGTAAYYNSNNVTVNYTGSGTTFVRTNIALVAGKTYQLSYEISGLLKDQVYADIPSAYVGSYISNEYAGNGIHKTSFVAISSGTTTLTFNFMNGYVDTFTIDNVSLIETSPRSTTLALITNSGTSMFKYDENGLLGGSLGIGQNSLGYTTSMRSSLAIGDNALRNGTAYYNNMAIGRNSLYNNTSGNQNIAIGVDSMYNNRVGSGNVAVGGYSLMNNIGNYNSALGEQALYGNVSGSYNVGFGLQVLQDNESGSNNSVFGTSALQNITSGSNNVVLGYNAGVFLSGASSGNIIIGSNAGPTSLTEISNQLFIDNGATLNPLIWGDFSSNQVRVNGQFDVAYSDSGNTKRGITSILSSNDAVGGLVNISKSRGTTTSPTSVQASDVLGAYTFNGYGGTDYGRAADIVAWATENYTATAKGSRIAFRTTPIGTNSPVERLLIDSNGNVGIGTGTDSPSSILHISSSGNGSEDKSVRVDYYNDTNSSGPFYKTVRYRGTKATPAAVLSGDTLGATLGFGYDGTSVSTNYAGTIISADSNWSTTNRSSRLLFVTTNGTATAERMRITSVGSVGIGTTTPTDALTVIGGASISGTATPVLSISNIGVAGSTTWGYRIAAVNAAGNEGIVSTEYTTTTGNASLNASNFNRLTWSPSLNAVSYNIYRTTVGTSPTTTGFIGNTTSNSFDDTGLAGDGRGYWNSTYNESTNVGIGTNGARPLDTLYVNGRINETWHVYREDFFGSRANVTTATQDFWNNLSFRNVGTCTGSFPPMMFGMLSLTTGATNGNGCVVDMWDVGQFNPSYVPVMEVRASVDATTNKTATIGWNRNMGAITTVATEGMYFHGDTSISPNWLAITRVSAGTETTTDTGIPLNSILQRKFRIEATNRRIRFYIDDVLVATHGTNIPNGVLELNISISTREAVAKTMNLDYIKIWMDDPDQSLTGVPTIESIQTPSYRIARSVDALSIGETVSYSSVETISLDGKEINIYNISKNIEGNNILGVVSKIYDGELIPGEEASNLYYVDVNKFNQSLNSNSEILLNTNLELSEDNSELLLNGQLIEDIEVINELFIGEDQISTYLEGGHKFDRIVVAEDSWFKGRIRVDGYVIFNKDTVGQAIVLEGDSVVRVDFEQEYETAPIVSLTQAGYGEIENMYVDNVTTTGFDIVISPVQSADVTINWFAFAVYQGNVFLSNGDSYEIGNDEEYWEQKALEELEALEQQSIQEESSIEEPSVEESLPEVVSPTPTPEQVSEPPETVIESDPEVTPEITGEPTESNL